MEMFSSLVFSCKTVIQPSTTYFFCFIILPLMLYVTLYLFKRSFCFVIFSKYTSIQWYKFWRIARFFIVFFYQTLIAF